MGSGYMEVAVITSRILHAVRRNLGLIAVSGVLLAGGFGCNAGGADMLTFAQDARAKGLKQMNAGDYEAASGSFRSATRQDPRDYKSFYYLGTCYEKSGSYQQAAQAYQASLKVMDVTLEGQEDKAWRAKTIDGLAIAVAKGTDKTANITMPQPGKKPAEDAWLRAKVLRYTGDADAALEAYNQAALQDPNDFYIAKDHALYLTELGQTQVADVQLRRAYRMNSKDPEVIAALQKVGTVPGPALKEKNELAKPPIPQGPIPELKVPKFGSTGSSGSAPSASTGSTATGSATVEAPRD